MKVRITGTLEDREGIIMALKAAGYDFVVPSRLYDSEDMRYKTCYLDIPSKDQQIGSNLQDWQVIEYCNNFRSKNDVARNFNIQFEAAEEILDRLAETGALLKWVDDKKYVYLDARWAQFVKPICGNCDHRTGWGDCTLKTDGVYCRVNDSCDKFAPSRWGFFDAINEKNYAKLKGE